MRWEIAVRENPHAPRIKTHFTKVEEELLYICIWREMGNGVKPPENKTFLVCNITSILFAIKYVHTCLYLRG